MRSLVALRGELHKGQRPKLDCRQCLCLPASSVSLCPHTPVSSGLVPFHSEALPLLLQYMERRHQEKLTMQAEIKRINDEIQKQKAELLAREKLADQMVMEFTKKKMVGL